MARADRAAMKILDMLTTTRAFKIFREGESHLVVWSANVTEQMAEIIRREYEDAGDEERTRHEG